MKKRRNPSKGRGVLAKAAKRKRPVAPKEAPKARVAAAKPKRKLAQVKPKRKPGPVMKPKRAPVSTKGPAVAAFQRRIRQLEGELRAREHDREELERWRAYHSQLQEQVKAKDSALAFKEKELLDLRRQFEELRAEAEKKGTSA